MSPVGEVTVPTRSQPLTTQISPSPKLDRPATAIRVIRDLYTVIYLTVTIIVYAVTNLYSTGMDVKIGIITVCITCYVSIRLCK